MSKVKPYGSLMVTDEIKACSVPSVLACRANHIKKVDRYVGELEGELDECREDMRKKGERIVTLETDLKSAQSEVEKVKLRNAYLVNELDGPIKPEEKTDPGELVRNQWMTVYQGPTDTVRVFEGLNGWHVVTSMSSRSLSDRETAERLARGLAGLSTISQVPQSFVDEYHKQNPATVRNSSPQQVEKFILHQWRRGAGGYYKAGKSSD